MAEALGMNVIYSDVRQVLPMGNAQQVSFDEVLDLHKILKKKSICNLLDKKEKN